jgi:hypothetical protein
VNAASAVVTDLDLYRRGVETAVACWTSYARAIPGAGVHRLPHVDVAVFTDGPERDVFNNAVLAHGLGAQERRDAVDALVTSYADACITSYAGAHRRRDRLRRHADDREPSGAARLGAGSARGVGELPLVPQDPTRAHPDRPAHVRLARRPDRVIHRLG